MAAWFAFVKQFRDRGKALNVLCVCFIGVQSKVVWYEELLGVTTV